MRQKAATPTGPLRYLGHGTRWTPSGSNAHSDSPLLPLLRALSLLASDEVHSPKKRIRSLAFESSKSPIAEERRAGRGIYISGSVPCRKEIACRRVLEQSFVGLFSGPRIKAIQEKRD
jgi:predicted RNA-binding protein YlxR (DUF448 family)